MIQSVTGTQEEQESVSFRALYQEAMAWFHTGANWKQAETAGTRGTQWLCSIINDLANKEGERSAIYSVELMTALRTARHEGEQRSDDWKTEQVELVDR